MNLIEEILVDGGGCNQQAPPKSENWKINF